MGKLALILVAITAAIGAYSASSSGRSTISEEHRASERDFRVVVRSAAHAGLMRAQDGLLHAFVSDTLSGTFDGIPYTTEVVVTDDEALITSRAVASTSLMGGDVPYEIQARIRSGAANSDVVPDFLNYALIVDGDLDIGGNGTIVNSGVTGKTDQEIFVHANGVLDVSSNSATVYGTGTYTTGALGRTNTAFKPYNDLGTSGSLSQPATQTDSVYVPPIVTADILEAQGGADVAGSYNPDGYWTTRYITGDNLSGPLPGGTRDNPMIYYTPGHLLLSTVEVDGYAVFVADGEVKIAGTLQGVPTNSVDGVPESAIAIYTPSDVRMNGGTNAYAQIYAGGNLTWNGNVDVYGSIALGGDYDMGGGATIHARPATGGLSRGLGFIDEAFELIAYAER